MPKISWKLNFDTDDNLPLNKLLKLPTITIVVRSVFEEDGKYYPQLYLHECYSAKKKIFMKELRLIKHMCKNSLCFAIIGLLKIWL